MFSTAEFLFLLTIFRVVLVSGSFEVSETPSPALSMRTSIQLDDWQCGHTTELRNLTYRTAMNECEKLAVYWNHACVLHDECYVRQLGQKHCDDEFDLSLADINQNMNASTTCWIYAHVASFAIKTGGESSYNESIHYTEPLELVKHLPSGGATAYQRVYKACPLANATLSSCALKFNICKQNETTVDCWDELCNCARGAYRLDKLPTCLDSVETFACSRIAFSVKKVVWCPEFRLSVWILFALTVLAVVVCCCCYICLWWRSRRQSSYTVVQV